MNNIISNIFCVKIIGYIDAHLRKKKIIVGSKAEGKETDGNHIKGTHSEIHIMRSGFQAVAFM